MTTFIPSEHAQPETDTLGDLHLDQETLREVASILTTNAATLEYSLPVVPEYAFGLSERGREMGHHTTLAHEHVAQSVAEVVTELVAQQQAITDYAGSAALTDEQTHDDLTRLLTHLTAAAPWAVRPDGEASTEGRLA